MTNNSELSKAAQGQDEVWKGGENQISFNILKINLIRKRLGTSTEQLVLQVAYDYYWKELHDLINHVFKRKYKFRVVVKQSAPELQNQAGKDMVGIDEIWRSFPMQTILWFYDI